MRINNLFDWEELKLSINLCSKRPAFVLSAGIILGSIISSTIYEINGANEMPRTESSEASTLIESTPDLTIKGKYFIKALRKGAHEEKHWDINSDGRYYWREDNFVAFSKTSDLGYESGLRRLRQEEPFQLGAEK
jgi:hypothetical protein